MDFEKYLTERRKLINDFLVNLNQRLQKERLSQARYARYSYDDGDYDSYDDSAEDVADAYAYESDADKN